MMQCVRCGIMMRNVIAKNPPQCWTCDEKDLHINTRRKLAIAIEALEKYAEDASWTTYKNVKIKFKDGSGTNEGKIIDFTPYGTPSKEWDPPNKIARQALDKITK